MILTLSPTKSKQQQFRNHFFARAVCLIIIPIAIYLFWFYVHFAILNTSGPGDAFMSPEFQITLKGNSLNLESHGTYLGVNNKTFISAQINELLSYIPHVN